MITLVINLALALSKLTPNSDTFEIGQQVIWSYKASASHEKVHKVYAEVVKLGTKRIQIKIKKDDGEFVKRWVNQSKLEKVNS